eukprot:CAMPEP_0202958584 /NCGR_PEP_ID=MMETSP1396-20130829/2886_1 /ASSEMBLY_ACC=CAM_ASM_000872 /TAXON_ID= /ORGANISM="Pseudokeronopsis sp., Strain Brazil" /LENGTH=209 /DNA_ID=CAMNT_0049676733 /DNA_START=470 /DNA_END=1102 /DNA_ORIENTATION=+
MSKLSHPNLMRVFEVIDCPLSDKLYLVMPVADYGECMSFDGASRSFIPNYMIQSKIVNKIEKAKNITHASFYEESKIKEMAQSLINALVYLHDDLNIVHRDIKPQNILVDEGGQPILADFGKARELLSNEDDVTTSIEGTPFFFSPECCSFDTQKYSMKKTDIWALGVTFYCIAFNRMPFPIGHTDLEIMDHICNHQLSFEGRDISSDF